MCIIFWLSVFYWNKSTFTGITLTDVKLSAPNNSNEKHIINNYYPTEITLGPKAKNFNANEVDLMNFSYQHTWGKYCNAFPHDFFEDGYISNNGYSKYAIDYSGYKFVLNDLLSQELIDNPVSLQYANMNPIYQIKNPYPYYKRYNELLDQVNSDDPEDVFNDYEGYVSNLKHTFKKGYIFATPELIDNYNKSIPEFVSQSRATLIWSKYHITPWQRMKYENALKQLNKDNETDKIYTDLDKIYHNGAIIDGYDCFNHMQKKIEYGHPAYKIYGKYISNMYAHYSTIIPQGLWMYNKTHYPKLPVQTRIAKNANKVAWTYDQKQNMSYYRTNLNHWLPATYIAKLDTHPAIFVKKNCKSLKSKDINQGYLYYGTDLQKGSGKYQVNINGKIYHNQYKTIKGTDYIPTIDPINNKIDDWIPISAIGQIYGRPIQRN